MRFYVSGNVGAGVCTKPRLHLAWPDMWVSAFVLGLLDDLLSKAGIIVCTM